jgi:uncharacterized small protein (DUF1192 family)
MLDYKVIIIITVLLATWFSIAYIDKKFNFKLLAWMNGEVENPFGDASLKQNGNSFDKVREETEITELKERIAVLEKIVTEPSYELNKKINSL